MYSNNPEINSFISTLSPVPLTLSKHWAMRVLRGQNPRLHWGSLRACDLPVGLRRLTEMGGAVHSKNKDPVPLEGKHGASRHLVIGVRSPMGGGMPGGFTAHDYQLQSITPWPRSRLTHFRDILFYLSEFQELKRINAFPRQECTSATICPMNTPTSDPPPAADNKGRLSSRFET